MERIELAAACAVFRQLKRDLGAIDFGDQISLALKVVEEHPDVAVEYRSASAPCCSTSIRTPTSRRRS